MFYSLSKAFLSCTFASISYRCIFLKYVVNYITSLQNQKAHEEEHRRPSSYHSFSQSPPYDYQYEEGRNGKRSAFLSRKPGSDKGHQGKISGFCYSSHSLHQRMSRDGFTGENSVSRTSNCSGPSISDTVRTAPQSPNFPDSGCFSPPVVQDQSNVQSSCGLTSSQVGRNIFFQNHQLPFLLH